MRLQIITGRYPSNNNPYNHMFVHTRNLEYLKLGYNVEVYVPSKITKSDIFENIKVNYSSVDEIILQLDKDSVVIIHLLLHSLINKLDAGCIYDFLIKNDKPTLFFIHGIETQKIWTSRREDISFKHPKSVLRFLYKDFYLIDRMKNTVFDFINKTKNTKFISVSKWMQNDAEKTLGLKFKSKMKIIPNGINTKLFYFSDEHWKNRHKLLSIRPLIFDGKYAIDLLVDTFKYIENQNMEIDIYGKGKDKNKIKNYITSLALSQKINLFDMFIEHHDIPKIHNCHGIYYAATRMDAQGVSMCEAMSSGMPVLSFDICAIPEFIQDFTNGILIKNFDLQDAALKIDQLVNNKNLFYKIAENGRKSMEQIDISITSKEELKLVEEVYNAKNIN